MMDRNVARVGCFGKMRSCGDFVSRHVPHTIQERFDQWLEEGLTETRERLNQQWLDYYLTSPIWRFLIKDSISDAVLFGSMMPSMDKVGRYYPLVIINSLENGAFLSMAKCEAIEELMLDTLTNSLEINEFDERLQTLNQHSFSGENSGEKVLVADLVESFGKVLAQGAQEIANRLCSDFLISESEINAAEVFYHETEAEKDYASVWWTKGSEHMGPTVLLCHDLPPIYGIHATLDGNWQASGWRSFDDEQNQLITENEKLSMEECCD